MTDSPEPSGPDVVLSTDQDGRVAAITLGETALRTDVQPGEEINLTQLLYDSGFEITTRSLDSFVETVELSARREGEMPGAFHGDSVD